MTKIQCGILRENARFLYGKLDLTAGFFIKSPEEGRLVRLKYREILSRFSLCCFVICLLPGKGDSLAFGRGMLDFPACLSRIREIARSSG